MLDCLRLDRLRLFAVILGMLAIGVLPALVRAQESEQPIKVSLCEIKAHPENYLHKLVEFKATAKHGFEDSTVEDSQCSWRSGGPGIWMEYGGKRTTATMYCCGTSAKPDRTQVPVIDGITLDLLNDDIFKEFDALLHPNHPVQRESDKVQATLRGRIFARYEGYRGAKENPQWRGYGHMGCCMLFVVTQVVSVEPPRP